MASFYFFNIFTKVCILTVVNLVRAHEIPVFALHHVTDFYSFFTTSFWWIDFV
jgi:hypothetical protein